VGSLLGGRATEASNTATEFLLGQGSDADTALSEATRTFSYGELRQAAAHLAMHLDESAVPPGARVGILASNSFFWAAAYLASMHGRVAVPLSDKLPAEDVAAQVDRVGCAAVFMDRAGRRRFGDALGPTTIPISDEILGSAAGERMPLALDVRPDDDALLLFTSGTTAAAKAVRLTHRNIIANTESIVSYVGLRPDDRMLVVLPFYYCYGLSLLNTHLRVGGSVALCNSFVFPEVALDMLETERCTGLAGVPSTFQLLLRASSFAARDLPHLRLIQQAGGKLSPPLVEELVAAKPGADLFVMYGQTEATARLSYLPPELVLEKMGSIGRGIPGVELRVVDEQGAPVVPGATGEIVASGENISPGYYDDPTESIAKFPGGVLRTGDLATIDEDGFIYIVDRLADFIKTWGHRVSSQEVEACVLRIPDLVSAAAVGMPDPDAGEAVTLAVTVRPESTVSGADIVSFARQHLAKHKVPKQVFIVNEMPLNASGKTDKNRVRSMLSELVGSGAQG